MTVDYWNVQVKSQIGSFPEQTIFDDPAKYASKIIRCNTLSAAEASNWERCQVVAGSNAIAYIKTLTDNLGNVKTNGLDFSAAYATTIAGLKPTSTTMALTSTATNTNVKSVASTSKTLASTKTPAPSSVGSTT